MKERITLEGYVDYCPGYEFDMDCFMLKPVLRHSTPGNDGGIDEIVEDYLLFRADGVSDEELDETKFLETQADLGRIRRRFQRLKRKEQKTACYWRRVVDFDPDTDEVFQLVEAVGGTCHL